jgi:biotin carboxyl carrier protein
MKRQLPRTYVRAVTLMTRSRVHLAKAREDLLAARDILDELSPAEQSQMVEKTLAQPQSFSEEREVTGNSAGDDTPQGEWVLISDRIVVSPGLGRFHPLELEEGEQVTEGALLGHIRENGLVEPVVARVTGTFAAWMVSRGQRVHTGEPLARLEGHPDLRE